MKRLVLALVLVAALPAPASAATVTSRDVECGRSVRCIDATLTAAAGEANDVTVEKVTEYEMRFRDDGAELAAGPGCRATGPSEATCSATSAVVATGDGDDRVRSERRLQVIARLGDGEDTGVAFMVDGGAGRDDLRGTYLTGGPDDDLLTAGDGTFILDGGSGSDRLLGDTGTQTFVAADIDAGAPAEPARDVVEGGGGRDTLSYLGDPQGVIVDLAATAGSQSDRDQVTGMTHVMGGAGDDVLLGDGGGNVLFGGVGHDVLDGRDGDDELLGGSGFDRFWGGAGADLLDSETTTLQTLQEVYGTPSLDPQPDVELEPVACGDGDDRIEQVDGDLLMADCERGEQQGFRPIVRPAIVGNGARGHFRLPCSRWARIRTRRCHGRIVLEDLTYGGGLRSAARFRLPAAGATVGVRLPTRLTPQGPREHYVRVTITYLAQGPPGVTSRYVLALPNPYAP